MAKGSKKYSIDFQKLLYAFIHKIKKMLWILGKDSFLFILISILLVMVFGELLFYKYVFLVKIKEPEIVDITINFQEDTYQSVLKQWQARENVIGNPPQKNYTDPFQ